MELMTRRLAFHYHRLTGKTPKRNWQFDPVGSGAESGVFLSLCRILAREVNAALPETLQREKPCDMAKIVRKVTRKQDREAKA